VRDAPIKWPKNAAIIAGPLPGERPLAIAVRGGHRQGRLPLRGVRAAWRGPVSTQDVRQQLGIDAVRLGARNAVSIPVARDRQRINRIDLPTGATETRHQKPARRFDGHRHRVFLVVAMSPIASHDWTDT